MEDKMFDLMTKMYNEIQEMKVDIKEVKTDIKEVKTDIKKIYNKIENDIEVKISALFDGYQQTYELGKENSVKIDEIVDKLDKQQFEIKVIQGGKK